MKHAEDAIQKAVADHLRSRAHPGVVWWHTPNGAKLGGKRTAKGFPIQAARLKGLGVRAGVSDIILFYRRELFALELKVPRKGVISSSQREFQAGIKGQGGNAAVAFGVDEAIYCLEHWGLLRGNSYPEYDANKDIEGSFADAYKAVRERVKQGGPGWSPK